MKTIVIVLDDAEKNQIQDFAAAAHMEVSLWCRMQIQKNIDRIEEKREAGAALLEMIRQGEEEETNHYLDNILTKGGKP